MVLEDPSVSLPIRRASLASEIGVENYMKLYLAELEAHAQEVTGSQQSCLNDSDSECSSKNHPSVASYISPRYALMSRAARIARVKCYEDMIVECLQRKHPQLVQEFRRVGAINLDNASGLLVLDEDDCNSQCGAESLQVPFRSLDGIKDEGCCEEQRTKSVLECINDLNVWSQFCEREL